MIENEKFNELIQTYINGNISDFKTAVKRMQKKTLIQLFIYLYSAVGDGYLSDDQFSNLIQIMGHIYK